MSTTEAPRTTYDRRWIARILAATMACFVAVGVAAVVLRPSAPAADATDAIGRNFVAACGRSGTDEDRCRCAWDAWQREIGADGLADLDARLADGASLPDALAAALDRC